MENLRKAVLGMYVSTRKGGIRLKGRPQHLIDTVDLTTPSEARIDAFREEAKYVMSHALIRQSQAAFNRMDNMVIRAVNAAMADEPLQSTGPALNGCHILKFLDFRM